MEVAGGRVRELASDTLQSCEGIGSEGRISLRLRWIVIITFQVLLYMIVITPLNATLSYLIICPLNCDIATEFQSHSFPLSSYSPGRLDWPTSRPQFLLNTFASDFPHFISTLIRRTISGRHTDNQGHQQSKCRILVLRHHSRASAPVPSHTECLSYHSIVRYLVSEQVRSPDRR